MDRLGRVYRIVETIGVGDETKHTLPCFHQKKLWSWHVMIHSTRVVASMRQPAFNVAQLANTFSLSFKEQMTRHQLWMKSWTCTDNVLHMPCICQRTIAHSLPGASAVAWANRCSCWKQMCVFVIKILVSMYSHLSFFSRARSCTHIVDRSRRHSNLLVNHEARVTANIIIVSSTWRTIEPISQTTKGTMYKSISVSDATTFWNVAVW